MSASLGSGDTYDSTSVENDVQLIDVIRRFPDKNWNWLALAMNPLIKPSEIFGLNPILNKVYFMANPNIDVKEVLMKSDELRDIEWDLLSKNIGVRIGDILDHLDENWYWDHLSKNSGILVGNMLENINLPWVWSKVSSNTTITVNHVLDHPDLQWDWTSLTKNPSITIDDIVKHPALKWDWKTASEKPGLRLKHLMEQPDKDWNWNFISYTKFE